MTLKDEVSSSVEAELANAVSQLMEEVKVLRMVIDELREEVQWNNQNAKRDVRLLPVRRIQSCSIDPADPNFEVNTVEPATVERLRTGFSRPRTAPGTQGELFG